MLVDCTTKMSQKVHYHLLSDGKQHVDNTVRFLSIVRKGSLT